MNRISTMPHGMKRKNFYCAVCGEKLIVYPKTRILQRGDPDYRKHNRFMGRFVIGKIELTEHEFKCMSCEKFITYDEQCMIAKIQKCTEKSILSQADIAEHEAAVRAEFERKRRIGSIVKWIFYALLLAFFIYYWITTGNITIQL